jgi:tetratricopeptide (TPR) repeat protein
MSNFFSELKQRNVYKVAVAYAVVGWLLVQIATQVFPFLEIPNWVVRLVIPLVVIGFPIALVIGWAFELTPEGLKRTEAADAAHQYSRNRAWIEEFKKARELNENPSMLGLLAYAYGRSGNKTDAIRIREELEAISKQRYVSAYSFALVHLGLGDRNEALRWLEKAYEDRAGETMRFVRVEPLLDPLHGVPRFDALAEKIIPTVEFKSATASK